MSLELYGDETIDILRNSPENKLGVLRGAS